MPTNLPPVLRAGIVEPRDAVRALQQRGLLQPSYSWLDVWQQEHAAAFAIAGVSQADVLQTAYDALANAARQGTDIKPVANQLRTLLQQRGLWGDVEVTDPATGETRTTRFDEARLRLIYDVNLRQSYAAGRWQRAWRNRASKPLMMYRTMRDERVRVSHARWDGLVLPIDHPFWQTHYPPNGWRCRCRAFAVSEADVAQLEAEGIRIQREAPPVATIPFVNRRTGEETQVPVGIDPGWAYNPGLVRGDEVARLQRNALDTLPPPAAQALVRQQLASDATRRQLADPVPDHQLPVGLLAPADARQIAGGVRSASSVVMLRGDLVDDLVGRPEGLTPRQLIGLQEVLASGRTATTEAGTLYVLARGDQVTVATVQADQGRPRLVGLETLTLDQARADARLQGLLP